MSKLHSCASCRDFWTEKPRDGYARLLASASTCPMFELIVESFHAIPEKKEKIERIAKQSDDRTIVLYNGNVEPEKGNVTILKFGIETRGHSFESAGLLVIQGREFDHKISH